MFHRKIEKVIEEHFKSFSNSILMIDGARQIGKSFIIRYVGQKMFSNYIEINMMSDKSGDRLFFDIKNTKDFYLKLSVAANGNLGSKQDTLVFLDEIQIYPELLTLLKFLNQENRFTYIVSGSMLGISLKETLSIPMGSINHIHMYPMDFEEFIMANGIPENVINEVKESFENSISLSEGLHNKFLLLYKYYLLSGGLPEAVRIFVEEQNIPKMRQIQLDIHNQYKIDAAQYDKGHSLKIKAIYDSIPSIMENKKKRIIAKDIENKKGKMFKDYEDEFEYLIASGIALEVKAIPTPVFPLIQSMSNNLLKLYINDPGILSAILFGNNINAILNDQLSVNLGSIYESAIASEFTAHGFKLYYYDNKAKGEVDFLVDDYSSLSVLPIEIKSGKDYTKHSSLTKFIENKDYSVKKSYVFSNARNIETINGITYCPIYMASFLFPNSLDEPKILPINKIKFE